MSRSNDVKRVVVQSFPRSGTHYLASLIALNLYNEGDQYAAIDKRVHNLPDSINLTSNRVYVYIYRDVDAVLRSLWNMRAQFNLEASNYDEFVSLRCDEMFQFHTPKRRTSTNFVDAAGNKTVHQASYGAFGNVKRSLKDYHAKHVEAWKQQAINRRNVTTVSYEYLKRRERNRVAVLNELRELSNRTPQSKGLIEVKHKVGAYAIGDRDAP